MISNSSFTIIGSSFTDNSAEVGGIITFYSSFYLVEPATLHFMVVSWLILSAHSALPTAVS